MGMYTLFHASFATKTYAPVEVKNALIQLADGQNPNLGHPFFKCVQCTALFRCSSAYFNEPSYCFVEVGHEYDSPNTVWVRVQSSLKNYHGEIEAFVDWIKPHIDERSGPVIYSRYEETGLNKKYI